MNTDFKNKLDITETIAQYDACAKQVIGNKEFVGQILARSIPEFKGMSPDDVSELIEGEIHIGSIPTEAGHTNTGHEKDGERIVGLNSENSEINEGLVRFDIIFYVRMKDGISQMIINIEFQKGEPSKYSILNRAIFYISRMVSSQKERDFVHSNYDDIKKVYSIWICMNTSENSLCHIHLTKDDIIGRCEWRGNLDILNIIMIGLTRDVPEKSENYELHRFVSTVFSETLTTIDKYDILEREYGVKLNDKEKDEVNTMCNLGEGIYERAMASGMARGMLQGLDRGRSETRQIFKLSLSGKTVPEIASQLSMDEATVRQILE